VQYVDKKWSPLKLKQNNIELKSDYVSMFDNGQARNGQREKSFPRANPPIKKSMAAPKPPQHGGGNGTGRKDQGIGTDFASVLTPSI